MAQGPRTGLKISRNDVLQAEAGSIEHIWTLSDRVTPQNITLDVVKVAFKHLRAELLPTVTRREQLTDRDIHNGELAMVSLCLISKLGAHCAAKTSRVKEVFVDELVNSANTILSWITLCVSIGGLSWAYPELPNTRLDLHQSHIFFAEVIYDLYKVDARIAPVFATSPQIGPILVALWLGTDNDGNPYMALSPKSPGDPIMALFERTLGQDDSLEIFLQHVSATPRNIARRFASALVKRLRLLGDSPHSGVVVRSTSSLISFTDQFFQSSDPFRKAFIRVKYVTSLSLMLNTLSARADREGDADTLTSILPVAFRVLTMVNDQRSRIQGNWADLVAGEFMSVVGRILVNASKGNNRKAHNAVIKMVELIGAYSIFPSVMRQFWKTTPPQGYTPHIRKTSGLLKPWADWWITMRQRNEVLLSDGGELVNICDNAWCARLSRGQGSPSKKCSGCSTVVYCSPMCQETDWKKRHSKECSQAAEDYHRRKINGTFYDHETRSYHCKLIASFCQDILPTVGPLESSWKLLTFECRLSSEIQISEERVKPSTWWRAEGLIYPQEHYLLPRLEAMWGETARNTARPGHHGEIRLVQGMFPNGAYEDVLLAVLLRRNGEVYEPLYSIPAYFSSKVERTEDVWLS